MIEDISDFLGDAYKEFFDLSPLQQILVLSSVVGVPAAVAFIVRIRKRANHDSKADFQWAIGIILVHMPEATDAEKKLAVDALRKVSADIMADQRSEDGDFVLNPPDDLFLNLRKAYNEFLEGGDYNALNRAITLAESVLNNSLDEPQANAFAVSILATMLFERYQKLGDAQDLRRSRDLFQESAKVYGSLGSISEQARALTNYGRASREIFELSAEAISIDEALNAFELALDLSRRMNNQSYVAAALINLAATLSLTYRVRGDLSAIDKSIACLEEVLQISTSIGSARPAALHNLATTLAARFERFGDLSDLDRAIVLSEQALAMIPEGAENRSAMLNNLGALLAERYERTGRDGELERAIEFLDAALDAHPSEQDQRRVLLNKDRIKGLRSKSGKN